MEEEPPGPPEDDEAGPPDLTGFDDETSEPPDLADFEEPPLHTEDEIRRRRAHERAARKRAGQRRLAILVFSVIALIVIIVVATSGGGGGSHTTTSEFPGSAAAHPGRGPSHLAVSTDVAAVPKNVLIADRNNDRLISISPRGQVVWTLKQSSPGDAYLSSTGRTVTISEHVQSVVVMRRVDSGAVSYTYGHPGRRGHGDNELSDPQTAQETPNGRVVIADQGNCRIVFITPGGRHRPAKTLGTPGQCVHHVVSAPVTFARPDAAFPTPDGGLVVTELSPGWVDVFDSKDVLKASISLQQAGFVHPSDANEYGSGDLIIADRTQPGKVEEFTQDGRLLWKYAPTSGAGELDRPTVATVLPNNDVMVADSGNDRVIVIHPTGTTSGDIVWQYGHTGKAGTVAGYLHTPDSAVLVPLG